MPSFSSTLELAIHAALAEANSRRHELATLEHLLLALVSEKDASLVMRACAVDLSVLQDTLVSFLDEELATLVSPEEGVEAAPTAAFQRVIQRAAIHVQASGRTEVTGANVLVAIFAERESNAAYFLQQQEMTRYDAVNFIQHGVAKDPEFEIPSFVKEDEAAEPSSTISQPGRFAGAARADAPFLFVSYSQRDAERITELVDRIKSYGIEIWWDQEIGAGDRWRAEIAEKLESASAVLTFWTENSTVSDAVVEEASSAQSNRKLIHVRLDRSDLPYGFSETQYLDLSQWDGNSDAQEFARLIAAISDKLYPPSTSQMGARIVRTGDVAIVAHNGKLRAVDAPPDGIPEKIDPQEKAERIEAVLQRLHSIHEMVCDRESFQVPQDLPHCLVGIRDALQAETVTFFAVDDACQLLHDCLDEHDAKNAWNNTVFKSIERLCVRLKELLPFLRLRHSVFEDTEPEFDVEPQISADELASVADTARELRQMVDSDIGHQSLDPETIQELVDHISQIVEQDEKAGVAKPRFARLRRSVKRLAQVAGGVVLAVGGGVSISLLTSPDAAATLATRLQPIFEALTRLFF